MTKPFNFLLIDDDADDRELFTLAIDDCEHPASCIEVSSCEEALKYLAGSDNAEKPDVIFLDLNMPQMNGRECLCELKKDIALSGIPVVIFSTSSETRDVNETRNLGAIDFITKPSKVSELTKILDGFMLKQAEFTNPYNKNE